jgi:hypothetical protein
MRLTLPAVEHLSRSPAAVSSTLPVDSTERALSVSLDRSIGPGAGADSWSKHR